MRRFSVIVLSPNGKPRFSYPASGCELLNGQKAAALMKTLSSRGHRAIAQTEAFGIEETLSTQEMADLFLTN